MKDDEALNIKRQQMRKGILSYAVLLSITKGEAYSSHLLADLKAANLLVVEGTLYPLLNRLKREGLLEYTWKESKGGPPRKYYTITTEGKKTLKALSITWAELGTSIKNITK